MPVARPRQHRADRPAVLWSAAAEGGSGRRCLFSPLPRPTGSPEESRWERPRFSSAVFFPDLIRLLFGVVLEPQNLACFLINGAAAELAVCCWLLECSKRVRIPSLDLPGHTQRETFGLWYYRFLLSRPRNDLQAAKPAASAVKYVTPHTKIRVFRSVFTHQKKTRRKYGKNTYLGILPRRPRRMATVFCSLHATRSLPTSTTGGVGRGRVCARGRVRL